MWLYPEITSNGCKAASVKATEENMTKVQRYQGIPSLPIGGKNTNCVIAGHRGYHGALIQGNRKVKSRRQRYIKNPWKSLLTGWKVKIIYPDEC